MVRAYVAGAYWDIELFTDDAAKEQQMTVKVYTCDGQMFGEEALADFFDDEKEMDHILGEKISRHERLSTVKNLITLLEVFQQRGIAVELDTIRPEAIMLLLHLPDEYWEFEWVTFNEGAALQANIQKFKWNGQIGGRELLCELLRKEE